MEKRLKEQDIKESQKRREAMEKGRTEQNNLLAEIAAKEEKRRMLMQELHREEMEIERGRQEYERKIEERKIAGR